MNTLLENVTIKTSGQQTIILFCYSEKGTESFGRERCAHRYLKKKNEKEQLFPSFLKLYLYNCLE